MEFAAQGEIYDGSLDRHPDTPKIWLHNEDDLYTNMAFLEVMRDKGLHASQDNFADSMSQLKIYALACQWASQAESFGWCEKLGLSGHPKLTPMPMI